MIWKLWFGNYNSGFGNWEQRIWKLWFGNYDLETMRCDLETGNRGLGNYDLETKARDLETITADLETMIWKLWGVIWKLGTSDLEPWFGNYEVWFANWGQRIPELPNLFNLLPPLLQKLGTQKAEDCISFRAGSSMRPGNQIQLSCFLQTQLQLRHFMAELNLLQKTQVLHHFVPDALTSFQLFLSF